MPYCRCHYHHNPRLRSWDENYPESPPARRNPCGYLDVGIDISAKQIVTIGDRVVHKLMLPGIRGAEEQREILKGILKKHGFEEVDDKTLTRKKDEIIQVVDLDELTITSGVELSVEREQKSTVQVRKDQVEEDKRAGESRLQEELRKDVERTRSRLEKEVSGILEKTRISRGKELDEIVNEVYIESLKKNAEEKGTITSVTQGVNKEGNFEMRIRGKITLKPKGRNYA